MELKDCLGCNLPMNKTGVWDLAFDKTEYCQCEVLANINAPVPLHLDQIQLLEDNTQPSRPFLPKDLLKRNATEDPEDDPTVAKKAKTTDRKRVPLNYDGYTFVFNKENKGSSHYVCQQKRPSKTDRMSFDFIPSYSFPFFIFCFVCNSLR